MANVGTSTLASPKTIRAFVDLSQSLGVNTLYVVTWNRGWTTYPSDVMEREFGRRCDPRYERFDVLREFIDAAHAKDMRVIAWFEFGFAASYGDRDGGHLLSNRPNWAARDVDGKIVTKNDFQWMNAFHPEVQDFVLSLLKEVVTNYDVDGVQGDDRLPACPSTAGYDDWTVARYQEEHDGELPPRDYQEPTWIDWRAQLLNKFMERMHRELKEINSQTVVSAAPSIFPWSKQEYLQDWPTWLKNGWVDEVCPQIYRESPESYRAELDKIVSLQVSAENLRRVFPGILVQTADRLHNNKANLLEMIDSNRAVGIRGEVIFYNEAIIDHPSWFRKSWNTE